MASGQKDYTHQFVTEPLVTRHKYGSNTVDPYMLNEIFNIGGPGRILGGFLWLDSSVTQKASEIKILVDGEFISELSMENLNKWNLTKDKQYPNYMITYDEVNFLYTVGISSNIEFYELFTLNYRENEGNSPIVRAHIYYT